jgi:hypothetical protein
MIYPSRTLGYLIEHVTNWRYTAPELACTYARLDLDVFAKGLGRKHSYLAPDLTARLECSACSRSTMLSSLAAAPSEAALSAGTPMAEQVASCPNGGILMILQADLENVGDERA